VFYCQFGVTERAVGVIAFLNDITVSGSRIFCSYTGDNDLVISSDSFCVFGPRWFAFSFLHFVVTFLPFEIS
jgi:hypothetical protein